MGFCISGCGARQPGARLPFSGPGGESDGPRAGEETRPHPAAAAGAGAGFTPLLPLFVSPLYSCSAPPRKQAHLQVGRAGWRVVLLPSIKQLQWTKQRNSFLFLRIITAECFLLPNVRSFPFGSDRAVCREVSSAPGGPGSPLPCANPNGLRASANCFQSKQKGMQVVSSSSFLLNYSSSKPNDDN